MSEILLIHSLPLLARGKQAISRVEAESQIDFVELSYEGQQSQMDFVGGSCSLAALHHANADKAKGNPFYTSHNGAEAIAYF
jgi:hypothetical protein